MRLGLGLNFLHRIISEVEEAVAQFFLLTEDDEFLIQNDPIELITEDGDNINLGSANTGIFTQDNKNISRQLGGFIMTQIFGEGDNAILEQFADGGKLVL